MPESLRRSLLGTPTPYEQELPTYSERVEQAEMEEEEREDVSFSSVMSAAIESEWVIPSAIRQSERNEIDTIDPDFSIGEQGMTQLLNDGYSDREIEFLSGSVSDTDYQSRVADIEEDRERERVLSNAGYMGVGARLSMAMLDPAMLASGVLTGGLALPTRAGRIRSILQTAALTGAESAAVEAMLVEGDTQKNHEDIFTAALMGAGIGAVFGGFARLQTGSPDNPRTVSKDVIDSAGEMPMVGATQATETTMQKAARATIKVRGQDVVDTGRIEQHKVYWDMATRAKAKERPLGDKELAKNATRKVNAEANIKAIKQKLRDDVAAHWAKVVVVKGQAREVAEAKVDRMSRLANAAISEQQGILARAQERLDWNDDIFSARQELIQWDNMSDAQKTKYLFPNQTPKRKKFIEAQITSIRRIGEDTAKRDDEFAKPPTPESDGQTGSVGAAQTENPTGDRFTQPTELRDAEAEWLAGATARAQEHYEAEGWNRYSSRVGTHYLFSDYTQLERSYSTQVAGFASEFLENPQGIASGHTVSVLADTNAANIRYAGKGAIDEGFKRYLAEQGVNIIKGHISPSFRAEYERQLALAVKGLSTDVPESIKFAADGVRSQLAMAGQLRKTHGEFGFENLELSDNYYPDIMDSNGISKLLWTDGWDMNRVKDLIALGYRTGANELTEAQARLMAHIKFENYEKSVFANDDVYSVFRAKTAGQARDFLKDAKVPDNLIDDFFAEMANKEDWAAISNRAKASLRINWEAEIDGVKISDIMNTNVSQVTEAYTREAAFGAAMAERGIKSEASLNRILRYIERDEHIQSLDKADADSVSADIQRLKDNITLLRGRSLVDYTKDFNKAGRTLLDLTAMNRLQQVGFATIPEAARVITHVGIGEFLRSVNGANIFRNPFNRAGGRNPETMALVKDNMEELEEIIGFIGEQDFNTTFTVRQEDIGSELSSGIGARIDNTVEGAGRISRIASGHNLLQGGMEKLAAQGISRSLIRDALGKKKINRTMRQTLRQSGIDDKRWEEISEWVRKNHGSEEFGDRNIDTWNWRAMPADMRRDMQVAMNRIHKRVVQRGFVGEGNSDWYGAMARYVTQFKSYPLISLEKQLLSDVRGDKLSMASNFLWATALAYAAYSAQIQLRALGMSEDKAEEYTEEMLGDPMKVSWGVLNKHSQLASLGILSDIGLASGLAPQEMYDVNRYGYTAGDPLSLIPVVGYAQDLGQLGKNTANMGYDMVRDEDNQQVSFGQWYTSFRNTAPFLKYAGIGDAIRTVAEDE